MFEGIRLYFDSTVNQWLAGLCGKKGKIRYNEGETFMYDLVDQPFCCIYEGHDDFITVNVYIRAELGIRYEEPDVSIKVFRDGSNPSIKSSSAITGDAGQVGAIFLSASLVLRELLEEQKPEGEDFILKGGEEAVFEEVKGEKRPTMLCKSFNGGLVPARPYEDEFYEEMRDESPAEMLKNTALGLLNEDASDEDKAKAAEMMEQAARMGDTEAEFNIGLLYAEGIGVAKDMDKALSWLDTASSHGDKDAEELAKEYRLNL